METQALSVDQRKKADSSVLIEMFLNNIVSIIMVILICFIIIFFN